jgi:hypothetical protein
MDDGTNAEWHAYFYTCLNSKLVWCLRPEVAANAVMFQSANADHKISLDAHLKWDFNDTTLICLPGNIISLKCGSLVARGCLISTSSYLPKGINATWTTNGPTRSINSSSSASASEAGRYNSLSGQSSVLCLESIK